jgi:hypothetical protein
VAFFVLIFSIEFEQRLLILNRQQPEGRPTCPERSGDICEKIVRAVFDELKGILESESYRDSNLLRLFGSFSNYIQS